MYFLIIPLKQQSFYLLSLILNPIAAIQIGKYVYVPTLHHTYNKVILNKLGVLLLYS